ncbi:hypothetical protein AMECASPLE_014756 [Ameca splendens]|uniref:Uncharacterized protein n=1 Tax=Ameca splendens TaxID=208324 RepID=A0ABV0Y224_9TELE
MCKHSGEQQHPWLFALSLTDRTPPQRRSDPEHITTTRSHDSSRRFGCSYEDGHARLDRVLVSVMVQDCPAGVVMLFWAGCCGMVYALSDIFLQVGRYLDRSSYLSE